MSVAEWNDLYREGRALALGKVFAEAILQQGTRYMEPSDLKAAGSPAAQEAFAQLHQVFVERGWAIPSMVKSYP